ncbi:hypothetical protein EVAR_9982_1 [Eumeta japonica]|uniref:Uncharacterized protein n=1 Tax=Eumeta variegata TaxID=151549 RepID=A0A4C1TQY5_EUMVA|nr:hypothetical protein EVAR_9982_1 [Eumeta japonica]
MGYLMEEGNVSPELLLTRRNAVAKAVTLLSIFCESIESHPIGSIFVELPIAILPPDEVDEVTDIEEGPDDDMGVIPVSDVAGQVEFSCTIDQTIYKRRSSTKYKMRVCASCLYVASSISNPELNSGLFENVPNPRPRRQRRTGEERVGACRLKFGSKAYLIGFELPAARASSPRERSRAPALGASNIAKA